MSIKSPEFIKNSRVRVRGTYKDPNGTLYDPGSGNVVFKYKKPDNTTVTYTYPTDAELVNESTGVYHVDVLLNQKGNWYVHYENLLSGNEEYVELRLGVFDPTIP